MKAEEFSDALGFLDEDLIEEAGRLRGRSRPYADWKKWTAAACLAAALSTGFWALSQTGIFTSWGSGETSKISNESSRIPQPMGGSPC